MRLKTKMIEQSEFFGESWMKQKRRTDTIFFLFTFLAITFYVFWSSFSSYFYLFLVATVSWPFFQVFQDCVIWNFFFIGKKTVLSSLSLLSLYISSLVSHIMSIAFLKTGFLNFTFALFVIVFSMIHLIEYKQFVLLLSCVCIFSQFCFKFSRLVFGRSFNKLFFLRQVKIMRQVSCTGFSTKVVLQFLFFFVSGGDGRNLGSSFRFWSGFS